jgi:cell division septum initiation protein DivIVA
MSDIVRDKYLRLMAHIADLEDRIENLEQELAGEPGTISPDEASLVRQEVKDLMEELAKGRSELSRLSDGCGTPHPMQYQRQNDPGLRPGI